MTKKKIEQRKRNDQGEGRDGKEGDTEKRRLRVLDEGLEKAELEVGEDGPGGGCSLAGGSSICQCHRDKQEPAPVSETW